MVVPVAGDIVEIRGESKIITLRNWIRFVVVTPRAAKGHAQRKLGRGVHDVRGLICFGLDAIGRLIVPDPQPKEAGPQLGRNGGILQIRERVVFITGNLILEKRVVGQIFVQSTNDPISIPPDVRLRAVAFVAVGFGKPNLVQPEPRPMLAVG